MASGSPPTLLTTRPEETAEPRAKPATRSDDTAKSATAATHQRLRPRTPPSGLPHLVTTHHQRPARTRQGLPYTHLWREQLDSQRHVRALRSLRVGASSRGLWPTGSAAGIGASERANPSAAVGTQPLSCQVQRPSGVAAGMPCCVPGRPGGGG